MAKKPADNNKVRDAWNKANTKAKSSWNTARKEKPNNQGFEEDPIEDGTYTARLASASARATKKGDPFTVLRFVVLEEGEYQGQSHRRVDYLLNDDEERQVNNQKNFSKTMAALGYDVEKLQLNEVPELMEQLDKDRPFVEIYIKNWQGDKSHGINLYVNKVLSDEEVTDLGLSDDDGLDGGDDGGGDDKPAPKPKPRATAKASGRRR